MINPAGDAIDCGNVFDRNNGGNDTVIDLRTDGANEFIILDNSGNLTAINALNATGIYAFANGPNSSITITSRGDITVRSNNTAFGINSVASTPPYQRIDSSGDITATSTEDVAFGIRAVSGTTQHISSAGDIAAIAQVNAFGIYARSGTTQNINSSGDITATSNQGNAFGIYANSQTTQHISSSGDIAAIAQGYAFGINAVAGASQSITNSGDIRADGEGNAFGITARTANGSAPISINNSGDIEVKGRGLALGIQAQSDSANSAVEVMNSGSVRATNPGQTGYAAGIFVMTSEANSPITVRNSGSLYAAGGMMHAGIATITNAGNPMRIFNTGDIASQSHLAIYAGGQGTSHIYNVGHITGYVQLTEQNDRFFNQSGGVFETKKTSQFGGGSDLFVNEAGGTVQAATDSTMSETSAFEGLETFRNRGLISMLDGQAGDSFRISNTPGGTDLDFQGGGQLGLDVFLDGAASPADTFTIEGNVSGTTTVVVNNTNGGPGTFNSQGIPVIFVTGSTPSESNFQLAQPIDTGFFDYDLFLVQTGSGFWELRSFPGGSAQALPKLLTAAQDMWHQTSATWFDRTADLRVVLNGGSAPGGALGYDAGSKDLVEPGPNGLTPAVWMKGGGGRLDRDSSATTSAYGRTYTYDLDNEFSTFDLQVGVDMGQYDVISQGDVLILGVLGGFVGGKLDYDSLGDTFDFSGGQVGAYATYLNGGLFVDTLLNLHLYEINTPNFGFPDSLDATTVGLRTDAGYRFGSFTEGLFFEPLATIEVTWADIDGFNVGGNRISFSDDANVRGRIGGRVGTTMQAWEGTTMEPFLIASLWGNLSEDNSARLVSSGTTFNFNDDLDNVWGEISGGVNLFNFSQTTAVFAKVDYTFGEDVQGVGGKAGVRAAW